MKTSTFSWSLLFRTIGYVLENKYRHHEISMSGHHNHRLCDYSRFSQNLLHVFTVLNFTVYRVLSLCSACRNEWNFITVIIQRACIRFCHFPAWCIVFENCCNHRPCTSVLLLPMLRAYNTWKNSRPSKYGPHVRKFKNRT